MRCSGTLLTRPPVPRPVALREAPGRLGGQVHRWPRPPADELLHRPRRYAPPPTPASNQRERKQETSSKPTDVCSLALTAVSSLLKKYNIDPATIGRLEVGTESLIDKAKSVKTVLMQLFEPSGNTSLEGADTTNACYGGTNALFNAVNWIESRSWDGRDAIVVASDIALYDQPASRPTGGAGCVAMLVGPGAPLALDPVLRGTYMTHAYDFYKPDFSVEYPVVNGAESLRCYLSALDKCYERLRARYEAQDDTARLGDEGIFDYMAFHTPNCKLVAKSYGRLMYNDCVRARDDPIWDAVPEGLRDLGYEESLRSKELEKVFVELSREKFRARVEPCIAAPRLCGNMYTASLFCSLVSLISNIDVGKAVGRRIGLFSYGSGLASSLFTLNVTGDLSEMVAKIGIMERLGHRHVTSPEEYEEVRGRPGSLEPGSEKDANRARLARSVGRRTGRRTTCLPATSRPWFPGRITWWASTRRTAGRTRSRSDSEVPRGAGCLSPFGRLGRPCRAVLEFKFPWLVLVGVSQVSGDAVTNDCRGRPSRLVLAARGKTAKSLRKQIQGSGDGSVSARL